MQNVWRNPSDALARMNAMTFRAEPGRAHASCARSPPLTSFTPRRRCRLRFVKCLKTDKEFILHYLLRDYRRQGAVGHEHFLLMSAWRYE